MIVREKICTYLDIKTVQLVKNSPYDYKVNIHSNWESPQSTSFSSRTSADNYFDTIC